MKIAALQITTGPDKGENLKNASVGIREAADNGSTLIVLPEASSQGFNQGRLDTQAEELDGPFSTGLRQLAEELDVTIVAGMFRPADTTATANRVYNTALITGDGVHKGYDKIHTFDVADYAESDTVKPGGKLVTFIHQDAVVGVATCFDIRFPEQIKNLARLGVDLIVVPTSWADGDNKLAQWRALTVARALDAGVYIVAAGQARPGGEERAGQPTGPTGIGHSVVIAPTGERIVEAGYGPGIIYAEIDVSRVVDARKSLALLNYRY